MMVLFGFLPLPVLVFLLSFAVSALSGVFLIPWLHRLKMDQTVREEGLKSHYMKNGTPMMGGLLFLSSMIIVGVPLCLAGYNLWPYLLVTLGCGLVGFADDWLKVVRKHNQGVSGRQKMLALGLISLLFVTCACSEARISETWSFRLSEWTPHGRRLSGWPGHWGYSSCWLSPTVSI